jgi:glyoxylase-like metal-dependent hydrolase (beta-lactamase superfamily II)
MTQSVPVPVVEGHFDPATATVTYIVWDATTRAAAVIDTVLDYDPAAGRTETRSADAVIARVRALDLRVAWLLETHVHADHLSAMPHVHRALGGRRAIGAALPVVQRVFREIFNAERDFAADGTEFDHLFADGEDFMLGSIPARAMHTPGHTPACMTYVIGDAAFVGDTLFMPDYGTARCDFPGGDARALYRSIRRILDLPPATRVFTCHDYRPGGREPAWESTVAEQRARNVHVHEGVDEEGFVAMRTARDRTLSLPTLIIPSVQVNMRAGAFPPPESNGVSYLKVPLNRF